MPVTDVDPAVCARPSQASSPDVAHGIWVRFEDREARSGRAGTRLSVTASAAVPAKAATAITRHAIWPYFVTADLIWHCLDDPRREIAQTL